MVLRGDSDRHCSFHDKSGLGVPKMHATVRALTEAVECGTPDGYSTEQTEAGHKPLKTIHASTNKKNDFVRQVITLVVELFIQPANWVAMLNTRWLKDLSTERPSKTTPSPLDVV